MRQINLYLGPFEDINFLRIYAIMRDPSAPCDALLLNFPGQAYTWKNNTDGCENLDAEFGTLWSEPSIME